MPFQKVNCKLLKKLFPITHQCSISNKQKFVKVGQTMQHKILIKVFHEDTLCQGIFFEWLETLTYLMTKTLQCLSAHKSPSDEANLPPKYLRVVHKCRLYSFRYQAIQVVIWKGKLASSEGLSCADKHCRGFVIKCVKVSSHSKNQPRTWNTLIYTDTMLQAIYLVIDNGTLSN